MGYEKTVFIVGAGFSANAGLPLQSDFTKLMLAAKDFKKGPSRQLMGRLDDFVKNAFGFELKEDISLFPELEDIFTMIDLSANTGHHLGHAFSPQSLRSFRRLLLSRIIRMLNTAYLTGKAESATERVLLLNFLSQISQEKHQFVSLNWDLVIEGALEEVGSSIRPFYSEEIRAVDIQDDTIALEPTRHPRMLIAKMHGSINWLYCDCCRRTFSVPIKDVGRLAFQVLKSEEERGLYGREPHSRLNCPQCAVDLGVRLATFSFLKAMRTPMFESSWLEAEKALRRAKKWVFVGYSLPAADFEFKYLLKRIELARREQRPQIQVVTKRVPGSKCDPPAVASYGRFFGKENIEVFANGLNIRTIKSII